jgi:Xaa-Pro aminopeptidase
MTDVSTDLLETTRLESLRAKLRACKIDAFVSVAWPDNQYLTAFKGDTSAILVTAGEAIFICDPRFTEQAQAEVRGAYSIEEVRGGFLARVGERMAKTGARTAAFDPAYMLVAQAEGLTKHFPGTLTPLPDFAAALRMVKAPEEIAAIREASALAETAVSSLLPELNQGITEREVAARIEYTFKKLGATGPSFDTIVLFGPRSSLPHGRPDQTRLQPGDVVLLDFGCRHNGYCSDLTRTLAYATMPGAWFEEIYALTLAAQSAAIEAIKPGMKCQEADAVARARIAEAGYGPRFGHGLGHGVGIEIHENPRLNSESETVLEEGMVITVEPGIYLPGKGGVRIEDLAVVTRHGCELISRMPKDLKVIE